MVDDLPVSEPNDFVAGQLQLDVTASVRLEGKAPAVIPIAVDLDDQTQVAPEEVDEEGPDPYVDLWRRQAVAAAKGEEVVFELATGATAFVPLVERETQDRGLPQCTASQRRLRRPPQVGDRAGWGGYGDALAPRHRRAREAHGAVDPESPAWPPSAPRVDGDVNRAGTRGKQLPESGGAAVAEDRPLATGQDGGHPPPLVAQPGVPDCEHPSMHAMESARPGPVLDGVGGETDG